MKRYLKIGLVVVSFWLVTIPGHAFSGKLTGSLKVKGLRSPADILVYLPEAPPVSTDLSKATFIMDQQNLTFVPHILPVPVGATIRFPNNDKVDHNVFSLSRTQKFNLGSYKAGEIKTVVFDKPGIVELRCDMHAEMLAYIIVLQNPYFGITDAEGRFEIPDPAYLKRFGIEGTNGLPAGIYTVKTWHEKLRTGAQQVVVSENGSASVELSLQRGTPGVLYKR